MEKKFFSKKKTPEIDEIVTKNITDKELAALQYLGGYVLRHMYTKYRNSKNYKCEEYQEAMALLLAGKTETNSNAKIVDALSRGGLWCISTVMQRIFVISEKFFCIQTSASNIRKIDVFNIVKKLMEFPAVQNQFKVVVDSTAIKISKEVAKSTLYGILTLFIWVRSFSFAKDIVEKHKIKINKKNKARALRKDLKKMNTQDDD